MGERDDAEDEVLDNADDESPAAEAQAASDVLRDRSQEYAEDEQISDALLRLYPEIAQGFADQLERANDGLDYWDLYYTKLGPKQMYNGNSKIFVPIIYNAVNARKTRFSNQLFPQSGRYVEVTAGDEKPTALMSLLEHYVRRSKLRTKVTPALLKNGDIEGQYSVYVSWQTRKRKVAYRVKVPTEGEGGVATGEEHDDIVEETIESGSPHVEVLKDSDICILPATADSVGDALACGGSVTLLRRWSKSKIRRMLIDKEVNPAGARMLLKEFGAKQSESGADRERQATDAAGIKIDADRRYALVYETWTNVKIEGESLLCRVYYGSENNIVSARRNPYWADRCPILSVAVEQVSGSVKGISKVKPCADAQYAANDAVNEAMDSAAYALMPIIMTDPAKNPRVGSMVLNLAAIWETNPNDTQFAKFPDLWKDGFSIVASCKQEIFQTLSITPAIMPQSTVGMKNRMNQSEVAQEQQVDLMSTSDAVTVLEEGIYTPLMNFFIELDHQYRDRELTVRQFGEMGLQANMQSVPLIQMDKRYEFRWFGVEQARNQQALQSQIATMNVVRGIPPQQYAGYTLNLTPIISQLIENTFGARLAPMIFQDLKSKLTLAAQIENGYLTEGLDLPVHPMDDDPEHLKVHQEALQGGDPFGTVREHVLKHVMQQQMKMQAMMQQQGGAPGQPPGAPGVPGGPPQTPGVPGSPRPGATPMAPRGGQGPAGMIHQDQISDPGRVPRIARG